MITDIIRTPLVVLLQILILKNRLANIRRVLKSSADSIQHRLTLHLSTVRGIVDYDGRNNISPMLIPVIDLCVNERVACLKKHPVGLRLGAEAFSNAVFRFLPGEAREYAVGVAGAVFVDLGATFIVYLGDVAEEQVTFIFIIGILVDTFLPQVFLNNLLPTKFVSMVCCAVSSSCETIGLDEIISAVYALPVYEVRSHQHLLTELLVDVLEVLNEIQYEIVVARIPDIVFDAIVWSLH